VGRRKRATDKETGRKKRRLSKRVLATTLNTGGYWGYQARRPRKAAVTAAAVLERGSFFE